METPGSVSAIELDVDDAAAPSASMGAAPAPAAPAPAAPGSADAAAADVATGVAAPAPAPPKAGADAEAEAEPGSAAAKLAAADAVAAPAPAPPVLTLAAFPLLAPPRLFPGRATSALPSSHSSGAALPMRTSVMPRRYAAGSFAKLMPWLCSTSCLVSASVPLRAACACSAVLPPACVGILEVRGG